MEIPGEKNVNSNLAQFQIYQLKIRICHDSLSPLFFVHIWWEHQTSSIINKYLRTRNNVDCGLHLNIDCSIQVCTCRTYTTNPQYSKAALIFRINDGKQNRKSYLRFKKWIRLDRWRTSCNILYSTKMCMLYWIFMGGTRKT